MITLHARGAKKGSAHQLNTQEAMNRQEEEKLWKSGVLSVDIWLLLLFNIVVVQWFSTSQSGKSLNHYIQLPGKFLDIF